MPIKNEYIALLVIGLAIVAAMQTNIFGTLFSTGDGVDGGAGDVNVNIKNADKACGSTTMTMDFQDKYSASTDMSSYNGTVFIDGKKQGIVGEGSTFTSNGGKTLNVYYALDDFGNNYYASHASGEIPCTGQSASFLTSDILSGGSLAGELQKAEPYKLYKSQTAPTVTVYNDENNDVLTTTPLSITAGASKTARVVINWEYEEGYGVVDGNTLACRYTDSQIDQSGMVATLDGATLGPAKYVPSNTRFGLSASNESTKFWAFPSIDAKTTTQSVLKLRIKGDENNGPTARTNVSCEIIDTDLFETDSGSIGVGVEDSDDNTNVGRSTEIIIPIPVS